MKAEIIEAHKRHLRFLEERLPYADGPNYYNDQTAIAELRKKISRLEEQERAGVLEKATPGIQDGSGPHQK